MYAAYCIVIKQLYKNKTFTIKTLFLSVIGVFIFSKIAVDIYATFRVSYAAQFFFLSAAGDLRIDNILLSKR